MNKTTSNPQEENIEKRMARNEPSMHRQTESTDLRGERQGMDRKNHMEVATNETVTEVSPAMQYFRVHDVMEQLMAGMERKSTAEHIEQAKKIAAEAGVETDMSEMEASIKKPTALEEQGAETTDEQEKAVYDYLHRLAEDIVDALNKHKRSIAVIEADSMGERTTDKLGMKGDLNFIVNEQAGQELLESLKNQHNPMRVWRKNNYGFVLINKELGTRFVFVYQEGLGGVKSEKSPKGDPEYKNLDEIEEPTAKNALEPSKKSADSKTEPGNEPEVTTEQPTPEQQATTDLESRRGAVEATAQKGSQTEANTIGSFTVDEDERDQAA